MKRSLFSRIGLVALVAATVSMPAFGMKPVDRGDVDGPLAERALAHLSANRARLGLPAETAFQVRAADPDELGQTHVRVDQLYRGVRVFEGDLIVHMGTRNREVLALTDGAQRGIDVDVEPRITSNDAVFLAHRELFPLGPYVEEPSTELVVFRTGAGDWTLAYHVHAELENPFETRHQDFMIDAKTGAVLDSWDSLRTATATGTGYSQYSGTVSLSTNSVTGGYELRDTLRGNTTGNVTYNLNHATSGTGTICTDADGTWGDGQNYVEGSSTTAANGQTAAVDAHIGMAKTWDYYLNVHGRNGIDAAGKATYSRVHYSNSYDNAFWSDTCFCMTYGDGSTFTTLTSLDVAGHEMSHGVCARTANLTYRGESGGLNEANSDIFGTMVEFYARGGSGSTIGNAGGNYLIGEQLYTRPLRYMYKPSLDGKSPDAWSKTLKNLDVHYSSGVANHFFFLLAHGSQVDAQSGNIQSPMANGVTSVTGLGNDKAARIWYRALTTYMTSSTTYAGARTATLKAAADLFGGTGSAEYATVNTAWLAVNVK